MGVEFVHPLLFLLAIPCAYIVFLFWKQAKPKGVNQETIFIISIRSLVFLFLILALVGVQILLPIKGSTVIFLVDQSASVKGSETDVLRWIEKSSTTKEKNDSFGIAVFGGNVETEQSLTTKGESLSQFNTTVNLNESNVEAGIQLAASMIPNDTSGRIVLFTDGNETTGNASEAAELLKNKGIELDTIPLNYPEGADAALTEFSIPSTLFEGEEASLSLKVESNKAKAGTVRISVNNQEIITEKIDIKEGTNQYSFKHKATESGLLVYEAHIVAEDDTYTENNQLQAVTTVKGTPKVLIVQRDESGGLAEILKGSGLIVETSLPEQLPTTLSGYLQYQSIVFNNVPGTEIAESQMSMIEQSVKEFGNGFAMLGGEDSFGLGGYFKTPIERLLPIDMDIKGKDKKPSLGLVMVLDRSGSMEGQKLTLAKEAAARSVELLDAQDTFGFIAFDDQPWVVIDAQPLSDKEKVMKKIRSISPGGGTEIYSSLEKAYEILEDLKLQRKHVILLTDGQSNSSNNYEELLEEGMEKNITLSTVSIGQDADQSLLEELAEWGGGRFYDVTDASVIPSILSRETVMASRTYIEDNPFYPTVGASSDWTNLFQEGVPIMNAYIATTPKQRASLALVSEKDDPVLSTWQYGMGTTVAFTSDVTGKWSGDWPLWQNWPKFINQLITSTLPKYDSQPYEIGIDYTGEEAVVTVKASSENKLPLEPVIISESGEVISVDTRLTAPGKYEIKIPKVAGMYFLRIKQKTDSGEEQLYQTGFTVPYPDEYLRQGKNEPFLKQLRQASGGKELSSPKESFRDLAIKPTKKAVITEWLLITAFLLFFMEIALRRFGLSRIVGLWKRRSPSKSKSSDKLQVLEKLKNSKKVNHKINHNKTDAWPTNKGIIPKQKSQKLTEIKGTTAFDREENLKRLLEAKKRKMK